MARYKGLKKQIFNPSEDTIYQPPYGETDIPDAIDWRKKVYVTPVKNQVDLFNGIMHLAS